MQRTSAGAIVVRPGPYFFVHHLISGFLLLCAVQIAVLAAAGGPAIQVTTGLGITTLVVVAGARTQLRIDGDIVMIRNPWYTRRLRAGDIDAITPQRVLDRPRSCNCLAVRLRGTDEGWPVAATLRSPTDGPFDVWTWDRVGRAVGVLIEEAPVNPSWRPGSFRRRRQS